MEESDLVFEARCMDFFSTPRKKLLQNGVFQDLQHTEEGSDHVEFVMESVVGQGEASRALAHVLQSAASASSTSSTATPRWINYAITKYDAEADGYI